MREKSIFFAFRLITYILCLTLTIAMAINWSIQYSLNEDLSQINFKHYQDTEEDVYPDLSLCFGGMFQKKKLAEFDPTINGPPVGFDWPSNLSFQQLGISNQTEKVTMLNIPG